MSETIRIIKGAITHHVGMGRLTLQVPTLSIGGGQPEYIDVPADHFTMLKGGRTALGREQGSLYLSPKGWQAHRREMLAAWPNDPAELEMYVISHFARVAEQDEKEYQRRLARVEEKPAKVRV